MRQASAATVRSSGQTKPQHPRYYRNDNILQPIKGGANKSEVDTGIVDVDVELVMCKKVLLRFIDFDTLGFVRTVCFVDF